MYHVAAQHGYIHITDLHTKNMVNGRGIIAIFCKTAQMRDVKILIICISDLAATRLEEKRFWKEEQIPSLGWKKVIWLQGSIGKFAVY